MRDTGTIAKMLLVCVALVLPVYADFTSAGRAADEIPVTAVFTNNADDNIRSDNGGAYLNGVDGVVSIIDYLDDLILQLHYNGKRSAPRRQMFFDFTHPVAGSASQGTFYEDAFLNVDSIGTMAVGATQYSAAQFNTHIGLLRFNSDKYPGTSKVKVEHPSDTTWVITASPGLSGNEDVAVLVQQAKANTFKTIGYYHMPFQITVQLQ